MFSKKKLAMIVAEALATAVLTLVILAAAKSAIGIPYFVALGAGLTLAMLVLTLGSTSGAHANPAITLGMWSIRKMSTAGALVYIAAQFLGAVGAWRLYMYFTQGTLQSIAGKGFDWHILIAEAVGTLVFAFGVAAAYGQNYEGGKLAASVGGSLALGILVAGIVSNGLVNPAVALGVQSWSKAYVVGPAVGAVVGMNLYHFLFNPKVTFSAELASVGKATSRSRTTTKKRTTTRKRK